MHASELQLAMLASTALRTRLLLLSASLTISWESVPSLMDQKGGRKMLCSMIGGSALGLSVSFLPLYNSDFDDVNQ